MKYLLDTCVLSELVKSSPDFQVIRWFEALKAHEIYVSAMTWAELQRGVARMPESRRRSELALWLAQLETGLEDRILAFDKEAAQAWAHMTVAAEIHGKPMAAFDSIIAATARAHACKLVTRNVRDFVNAGVDVVNPWNEH